MEHILQVKADISNLDEVLDFVNAYLEEMGFPAKEQRRIDVVVEEVFVNIASYAYEGGEGEAFFKMDREEDGLAIYIEIVDSGVPYNPLEKEDPDITLPAEERPIGGLGIFLVKKMVDKVSYEYLDGKNILRLRVILSDKK